MIEKQTNKRSSLTKAYEEAFVLSVEKLLKRDLFLCCKKAGAKIIRKTKTEHIIDIKFLNQNIFIEVPAFTFFSQKKETVDIWEKILILHYLLKTTGNPLKNIFIDYRQVKSGNSYFPAFEKRSIKPLIKSFGDKPALLLDVSKKFGGERAEYGDFSIKISAFPLVPVVFIIWLGSEEFQPSANILFDATIEEHLLAEDIAVLCQQIVFSFIKGTKQP